MVSTYIPTKGSIECATVHMRKSRWCYNEMNESIGTLHRDEEFSITKKRNESNLNPIQMLTTTKKMFELRLTRKRIQSETI